MAQAPPAAANLGTVVFVLVEFQLVDHDTELSPTRAGEASHSRAAKERQRDAVRDRPSSAPTAPPEAEALRSPTARR